MSPKRMLCLSNPSRNGRSGCAVVVDAENGYKTETALDGSVAIERLSTGYSPDVVVLDLKMAFVSAMKFSNG
jgi:CheY-like chemotaxis protein